jgi:hypothetical protein
MATVSLGTMVKQISALIAWAKPHSVHYQSTYPMLRHRSASFCAIKLGR